MNSILMAGLACAAALALVACSGNNATAPAAPGPGPTDPVDPPPDDRTEAQKAFDAALKSATDELAEARKLAAAAAAAVSGADTAVAREKARTEIEKAQEALAKAVAAARALEAPSGDDDRRITAIRFLEGATEAQTEDDAKLRIAEGSTSWAGRVLNHVRLTYPQISAVSVVRRNRRVGNSDASTLLTADSFPPVMYEDGKIVISKGLPSSGDRLRMRGIPVSRTLAATRELAYSHQDRLVNERSPTRLDEPYTVAGLTITSTGLVIDIGGKGADGADFRKSLIFDGTYARQFWVKSDGSNGGYDLTLTFGEPADSPEGNAEYFWEALLLQAQNQLSEADNLYYDGERVLPLGTYNLRLSNFRSADLGLEDADGPAYPSDDEVSYLSYAAYGFFDFILSRPAETSGVGHRTFPFHVGYDAFANEDGMKVTDVADARKITKGRFKGRTMAANLASNPGSQLLWTLPNTRRLRGDVELTATISGTGSDNKISGKIMNLEQWDDRGYWEAYSRVSGDVTLAETQIDASGSFIGHIDNLTGFQNGGYRGNFYGPLDGLEAGGIWYMNPNLSDFNEDSVVGSFGAKLVPADDRPS